MDHSKISESHGASEPHGENFPIRTGLFLDLKKLWDVPSIIVYHFCEFEKNLCVRTYLKNCYVSRKSHIFKNGASRRKFSLLNRIFPGPEKNHGCFWHHCLPFLKFLRKSECRNILKKLLSAKKYTYS